MSKPNYEMLAKQGYEYVVIAAYDGPFGEKGDLISKHRTYENAEKAANRKAPGGSRIWVAIRDTRSYA